MKRVLIVGSGGQDGKILFNRLSREECFVVGVERNTLRSTKPIDLKPVDILKYSEVNALMESILPDEIYYLAAFHQSSEERNRNDLETFERSFDINVKGLLNFLEAIRLNSKQSRLFYAASSHVFGEPLTDLQDEMTPLNPICPYGITKAAGLNCCRYYRVKHSLFITAGILYNHESVYRKPQFVSKKITQSAVGIKKGIQSQLLLGDPSSRVDWGYAPDYVEAMVKILRHGVAEDFIVATGEAHTVREFAEVAFNELGLNCEKCLRHDPNIVVSRNRTLIGDATKLKRTTGWNPSKNFEELVRCLVKEEESVN